jgi:hypothetical protein
MTRNFKIVSVTGTAPPLQVVSSQLLTDAEESQCADFGHLGL